MGTQIFVMERGCNPPAKAMRFQIGIFQRQQFEPGVDLNRSFQVRLGRLKPSHLCFVAGKVELNRRVGWMEARCVRIAWTAWIDSVRLIA
jgi:hypothetical protein